MYYHESTLFISARVPVYPLELVCMSNVFFCWQTKRLMETKTLGYEFVLVARWLLRDFAIGFPGTGVIDSTPSVSITPQV